MSTDFDTTKDSPEYLMTVNGLAVGLNMPVALVSKGDPLDGTQGLPPYHPRRAFLVDEYPACPANWPRSSGRTKSYFVPVRDGSGIWLDFNRCTANVAQYVAIVPSIQGVNAITGLPCHDAQIEQYIDKCPKHKKAFGPDRFCKQCNYRWAKQNYLSSAGTPQGSLWLDGFRAEDGTVRQYVITSNDEREVAKAILGKDRVFALGISFFLSKENRPAPVPSPLRGFDWDQPVGSSGSSVMNYYSGDGAFVCDSPVEGLMDRKAFYEDCYSTGLKSLDTTRYARSSRSDSILGRIPPSAPIRVEQLGIAAGAKISQRIWDDPNDLSFWRKEPEGLIVINYASEKDCKAIIAAGKVNIKGSPEGFLKDIPVGNK